MRVLQITNNYPTNKNPIFGIFVKEQIDSLKKYCKCDVFFINGRERGKFEYLYSIFKLRKILNKKKYNVIHCHHVLSYIVFYLSFYKSKSKIILSYQNDPSNEFGIPLFNFIRKKVDSIIFKNNTMKYYHNNVYYIPNGVNLDFFTEFDKIESKKKVGLDIDKKYVLFVSSNFIRNQKRYDIFKKTVNILKTIDSKFEELLLINQDRENVPFYFNSSELHLLTSDFEGSPNSVKEALACNLEVVSTNVGNVKYLLNNLKNSYVSESNDPKDLAKLVLDSIEKKNNSKNRNHLINNLKLDIDSVANQIMEIYK